MKEILMKNKKKVTELSTEFNRIFSKQLHQFMHPLFGFDIIKFDNAIGTPDNISMANFIKNKYGIKSANLIKQLIK